jgi:type 1 glutamine amidotransferase
MKLRLLTLLLVAAFGVDSWAAADARKKLVMLIAEHEYETATTLPEFAAKHLAKDFRVVTVTGSLAEGRNDFDRIEEVADADILLVSVRRRTPPKAQLELIRRHVSAGKPVVGIRTASHAFSLRRGQVPEGHADWPEFDAEAIGGSYTNHHGSGPVTTAERAPGAPAGHPILRGVTLPFTSKSSLYKTTPLRAGATVLLNGSIPNQPAEPIAWTFTRRDGGRTFYTSLGSPSDFQDASFVQLLRNGLLWAAQPQPPRK